MFRCRQAFLLPLLLLLVACYNCNGQRYAGESCRIPSSNTRGVCQLAQKCHQAFANGRPELCSYSGTSAIICCPSNSNNVQGDSDRELANGQDLDDNLSQPPPQRPNRHTPSRGTGQSSMRTSQKKCEEYAKLAVKKFSITPLVLDPETFEFEVPQCDYTVPLIVDGEKTKPGEFPHMAALGWQRDDDGGGVEFNCGGVLISDRYVATAAHCALTGNPPKFVRLGDQNLFKDDDNANPTDYQISQITIHPEYRRPKTYNDIALLRLERRVKFTKYIRPACLWQQQHVNVSQAIATGWGLTDFAADRSDDLLKVLLNIYPQGECQRFFERTRKVPGGIVESQLCAGPRGGRQDTCQGDSGGPLQLVDPANRCLFHVIGLTSFGKSCGLSNSPGVYTRISAFLDWIEPIVWP